MKLKLKIFIGSSFLLLLPGCVAYMENQAIKNGKTGDPGQGGYFGFSEQLSDQRIAHMERSQRYEQGRYNAKKGEEAELRRQLAEAEIRMKHAANAEARAIAQRDIDKIRNRILVISTN
jgi:hypothetical protein